MKRPIRVLILEDKPSDMELTLLELRRAGFDPEWECVETEEGFLASLQRDFDIILSDYSMPQFDGLRALALLRRRGVEIPFILVSGTMGEETAVAAMKQGATDYLLKDRLGRLGPAVTQALEQGRLRKENARAEDALRESEERFRQLAENIKEVFWLADPARNVVLYVSPAYETIWGRSRAGVYASALSWLEAVHSDDRAAVRKATITKQADGTYNEEYRIVRPDGSIRWIHDRAFPVRNGAGEIYRMVGVARDVTERKEAEVVLLESERRFREMLENVELIGVTVGRDGRVTFCNEHLLRVTGWKREEVMGADWLAKFVPDQYRAPIKDFLEAGEIPSHYENPIVTRGGDLREIAWNNTVLRDTAGKIVGTASLGEDVTDRKRLDTLMRESEERMRSVLESALDCVITMDDEGKVVEFNPAAERTFGYGRDEVVGQLLGELIIPPALRERHRHGLEHYLATNEGPALGKRVELTGMRKDNSEFPLELAITRMGSQEPPMFTGFIRDITVRKQSEDRLREQAKLLDLAQDAIMVRDMEDRVEYWNHGAEKLYGWTAADVQGKQASTFLHEDPPDIVLAARVAVTESGKWSGECKHLRKDGAAVVVRSRWTLVRDDVGNPKAILTINTDITEQKRVEEQFLRAQRLESIGTLASGVAHDLNNILVPILMAAPLLRENLPKAEREKFLNIVESSAERGASIVKQVLTFARGADGDHVLLQPSYLIGEIAAIAERTFPKSIAVSARYHENIRPLEADATQLHQVLLNLVINARDAMPHGGNLTLSLENFDVDDHYASMTPGAKPGPHVVMEVSDTGTGIPRHIIGKIYDPFFTTKGVGLGTGLGLSTVLGIVKSHGGFMHVSSEAGHTSFKVFLPAAPGHDCTPTAPLSADIPTGQGQTILVVDDELAIREVARAVLVKHGYKVLMAEDGPAALVLLARHSSKVKVMLTDMVMPFMDGPTLVRAARRMAPEMKVILSTGRDEDSRSAEVAGLPLEGCLTKPYTRDTLLLLLDHVLNPIALLPAV